jgi:hypothetical protein
MVLLSLPSSSKSNAKICQNRGVTDDSSVLLLDPPISEILMAYFVKEVLSCQERHLGPCPSCGARMRFKHAIVCYPPTGKHLPRFPEPLDCMGADIKCPDCEALIAFRVPVPFVSEKPSFLGKVSHWFSTGRA